MPATSTSTATSTTNASNLSKMLSFFRKTSKTQVMANANASETTLVSTKSQNTKKPKREYSFQPEFTGMGALGGMPSLGGLMFVEPPSPTESTSSNQKVLKMVPEQPFVSAPRASVVDARLDTVKGMFASPPSASSVHRKTASEMVADLYAPSAVRVGGATAPIPTAKKVNKNANLSRRTPQP
ncbi:conserved hypothetical protein [Sporisorium reilianum SRZ2]|uniref:Uncharacterized protein n=1 Tax=Sporisorium reilianum (strain SRZ2) TaxID=999809 RepID=E6ZU40_SPORE|nr:conserved hypothetical protein [Sporisorium reilianum SRZ2]